MNAREIKFQYRELLKRPEWRVFSRDIITERGECWACGAVEHLDAHHLTYRDILPWEYDPNEIRVLCRRCHEGIHQVADLIWTECLRFEPHQMEIILKRLQQCRDWRDWGDRQGGNPAHTMDVAQLLREDEADER